jgi:hypothetical protein
MRSFLIAIPVLVFCLTAPARAQFGAVDPNGAQNGKATTSQWQMGFTVTALGGPCMGIVATVPVPFDWPEQQVHVVKEEMSPTVEKVDYRTLAGGVKQMVVTIPRLGANQTAKALLTVEVVRHDQLPPDDTTGYTVPKKADRDTAAYLAPSPYIESKHPKIVALAKELTADKQTAWEKIDSLYDGVKQRVVYRNGALKGALKALADGDGDCEEMSSLFIALCRASNIPARTVWVPGHCYPEFYLDDAEGKGHWFPCNLTTNARVVGGIPEPRPILQKGDNFKDPDRPKEKLHYVSEYFKCDVAKTTRDPHVEWVLKQVQEASGQ